MAFFKDFYSQGNLTKINKYEKIKNLEGEKH